MRRFSQRNSLVTLSDINITPLLDLAFVLLIIFVITTPLLEQSLELKLPKGGKPDRPLNERDFHTVEISPRGYFVYDGKTMALAQIEKMVVADARANPNLVLRVRADRSGPLDPFFQVADMCANHGIKVQIRSEPRESKR